MQRISPGPVHRPGLRSQESPKSQEGLGPPDLVSVGAQAMCGIGEPELQIAPKIGLRIARQRSLADLPLWICGVELGPAIALSRLSHGDTVMRPLPICRAAFGELRKIYELHNLNPYPIKRTLQLPAPGKRNGSPSINFKNRKAKGNSDIWDLFFMVVKTPLGYLVPRHPSWRHSICE
jgi:hypothetical protein